MPLLVQVTLGTKDCDRSPDQCPLRLAGNDGGLARTWDGSTPLSLRAVRSRAGMWLPVRYSFSTRGSAVWSGTDAQAVQKIVNTTVVMILMIVAPFAFE